MKRNVFLIVLMMLLAQMTKAQNDTMYVMKDGVVTHKISVKEFDVDSIIFYKPQVHNPPTVVDIDGNVYKIVTIGEQTWMAENLKTTKYNNGISIPLVTDNTVWVSNINNQTSKPMMSWYNNDITNKTVYGALYNWYALSSTTNGKKNICPIGWHIPSDAEWTILENYIGTQVAKKLKSKTGWKDEINGTDDYGFSGFPGGYRGVNGTFYSSGTLGYWWNSTSYDIYESWTRNMFYADDAVEKSRGSKAAGFSVRCVMD